MSKRNNHLNRPENRSVSQQEVQISAQWSSPLPPPAMLEQYKNIDPNFLTKIVDMIEKEGNHRRAMNQKSQELREKEINIQQEIVNNHHKEKKLNFILAAIIIIGLMASSFYLALDNKQWPSIAPFVVLIGYLIYGKSQSKKNKKENDNI